MCKSSATCTTGLSPARRSSETRIPNEAIPITRSERPLTAAAESTVQDNADLKDEPGDFIETNCHWVKIIIWIIFTLVQV